MEDVITAETPIPENSDQFDQVKEIRAELARCAEEWNRRIYEPNKERVAEYRKRHGKEPPGPQDEISCRWCCDEVCVYDQSPACTDYCPTENFPGLCRFDSRGRVY